MAEGNGSARRMLLGQFRLVRLQVVNWGTFGGYKDFVIDERGVLFTGPSGCGKSTLMDGHSVALLPTRDQRFNASADLMARGAKQGTRSPADYVRGAWSENDDEHGQSQVRYLRGGKSTWSALAATYDNGLGQATTAVVIKYFAGTETDTPGTHYMLHDGDFGIEVLNDWAKSSDGRGMFSRALLRGMYPKADVLESETDYTTRLAKRVGLGPSYRSALTLLGKAKAMKNVGDLNLFVRENMLDEPETFTAEKSMLGNYQPLEEAFATAERAHLQAEVLSKVPTAWEEFSSRSKDASVFDALAGEPAEQFLRGKHLNLLDEALESLRLAAAGLKGTLADQQKKAAEAERDYESLAEQLRTEGQALTALEADREKRQAEAESRREAWKIFSKPVQTLDLICPATVEEFEALGPRIAERVAAAQADKARLEPTKAEVYGRAFDLKRQRDAKKAELDALSRARTLIGAAADARRAHIAEGAKVPADQLVYAAELIDVAEAHSRWRPAAEKVLRNFGQQLLVPEPLRKAVAAFIDAHDMRGIVEYSIIPTAAVPWTQPAENSLAAKLAVDEAHPAGSWVAARLASRFAHVCVETATELEAHAIAVTVNGTVKSGTNQYRKDDRPELTNPDSWILGGNIEAKKQALATVVGQLLTAHQKAETAASDLERALKAADRVIEAADQAAEYTNWSHLDYWESENQVADLTERINDIIDNNVDLAALRESCAKAKNTWNSRLTECAGTNAALADNTTRATELTTQRTKIAARPAATVGETHRGHLEQVWTALPVAPGVDNIADVRSLFNRAIEQRRKDADSQARTASATIKHAIDTFIERWPGSAPDESGDVAASGASFAALHAEIVARGLPEAVERFQNMINTNVMDSIKVLYHAVEASIRRIRDRVQMVNTGLGRVEFNASTHLQISYHARTNEPFEEFKRRVDELLRHGASAATDPNEAKRQFVRIRSLMKRFTGQDTEARHWRERVLDVRSSFTFYGREVTADGETTETYRNTASNSGGEQEKLVAFCLAAALSYLLATDTSEGRPGFAPLMLDEAFSKSDESFAGQALAAFDEFGFQLMIAAPIRMSGVLEPFIGQAVLVEKRITALGARSHARSATFKELAVRHVAETEGLAGAHA